jgi:RNA polymerase sigma-70 factor (ECF subfamily)
VDVTELFEEHRPRLRAVAYRMLGSVAEAEDAVQEAWLRLSRSSVEEIDSLGAWLTTVVARLCLNVLRARDTRREDPLDVVMPDPLVSDVSGPDPEQEALLADSVGLALLVVLNTLTPPERLAFVLHDMFAVPFEEIGPMVSRTPGAARQLASRARRRVRDTAPSPDPDVGLQRAVVDAFFAAAREGDFDALVSVLHPDVVLRADGGDSRLPTFQSRGPEGVLAHTRNGARWASMLRPALVNGAAGVVVVSGDRVMSVMGFTVVDGKIAAIDVLWDPERLAGLDVVV